MHVFEAPLGGDGLGGLEPRAGVRDETDPGEDLIRLDHDLVGAVDPLYQRRTISERRIDAGLSQIGRFEPHDHAFCPPMTPNDGGGGISGENASCGTGGVASTNVVGSFAGAAWSPGTGGTGTPGGNAGGGGGGGAGGGYCVMCFLVPGSYNGSSGGGGGAGGCGGQAAPGGQQSGASFGIVAAAGSVLTLTQSRVVAGRSGDGGKGGVGGNGGAVGAHAVGAGTSGYGYHGGKGGDGGDGGVGGGGGGGAGGSGGPSVAVTLVGGAKVEGTAIYYKGSSGDFGGGGAGGISNLCNTGPGGVSGVLGLVAETTTYP